jgi:hypothetical protein
MGNAVEAFPNFDPDGKPGRDVVGGVELVNSVVAHGLKTFGRSLGSQGEARGWCSEVKQSAGISVSKRESQCRSLEAGGFSAEDYRAIFLLQGFRHVRDPRIRA